MTYFRSDTHPARARVLKEKVEFCFQLQSFVVGVAGTSPAEHSLRLVDDGFLTPIHLPDTRPLTPDRLKTGAFSLLQG